MVATLAEVAETFAAARTTDDLVNAIVSSAPASIAGFDQVSVTLQHRDGRVETHAASSDLVEKLDLVQYESDEGPCLHALRQGGFVFVEDMRNEQRWPGYVPRAKEAGVTAQMAVELRQVDRSGGGAMNFYSTRSVEPDPEAAAVAQVFAHYVAMALGWRRTEEQLNSALATRKTIGQALGIIMERYQVNEVRAFDFLTRISSTENIKLRDVAHELVTQTDTRYTVKEH